MRYRWHCCQLSSHNRQSKFLYPPPAGPWSALAGRHCGQQLPLHVGPNCLILIAPHIFHAARLSNAGSRLGRKSQAFALLTSNLRTAMRRSFGWRKHASVESCDQMCPLTSRASRPHLNVVASDQHFAVARQYEPSEPDALGGPGGGSQPRLRLDSRGGAALRTSCARAPMSGRRQIGGRPASSLSGLIGKSSTRMPVAL